MAHVEGGAIPNIPKYVNLQRLTNEELQAFKTDISRKKLHVTVACPHDLGIYIDEGCCQIIIQNVISNAVKYAARGGSISIAITPDDDTIHFAISDTGCGIPKDQQGDIFKKMFRASNAQVINVDGNGLGLYLVKLLVQHLQGDIRFTSREGHGTTFRVTLPAGATKEDGRSAHTTLI
jgi:signal transduction histidine kinase